MPYDAYHDLHLPHDPPLYPQLAQVPYTSFSCVGRSPGYYADTESGCQVWWMCFFAIKFVLYNKKANTRFINFISGLSSMRKETNCIVFVCKQHFI